MNAALRATGVVGAEFDEYELEALDAACAAADRGEQLQRVYDGELSGQARPTTLARLSTEIRHCERQSLQMLERVRLTAEPPKSPRHVRAAQDVDHVVGSGGRFNQGEAQSRSPLPHSRNTGRCTRTAGRFRRRSLRPRQPHARRLVSHRFGSMVMVRAPAASRCHERVTTRAPTPPRRGKHTDEHRRTSAAESCWRAMEHHLQTTETANTREHR